MPEPLMKDKTVVITGANSGLGFATALQLAKMGAHIVMVCRDPARAAIAQADIARVATGPAPQYRIADLSSQAAIRALAAQLRAEHAHIDVLINNAGGVFSRREQTVDAIERTLAVNYLAPFLLTRLLLEQLLAAPSARIVNVASTLHGAGPDVLESLQSERRYNFMLAYKQSKFALIVFTYELARRLTGTRVTVNCVEPGPSKTAFGDNLTGPTWLFPALMKRLPLFRPPRESARTIVYAASSRELNGVAGQYLEKCATALSKPFTYRLDIASKLWTLSLALTGASDFPSRSLVESTAASPVEPQRATV